MRANDPIDLLARECQDDQSRASWAPAQRERRMPRRPLIPRHLSFEGAEVEQPGLDLDDQQRPAPPVESKEIDPAMRSTLDDLDLTSCNPALGSKVAIGIGRTSGVDHISNVWAPGKIGGRTSSRRSRPSASPMASMSATEGFASPRSIRPI